MYSFVDNTLKPYKSVLDISRYFTIVLNERLLESIFVYAFDFDGVLSIISEERHALKASGDGESYASPCQFIKDVISPLGIAAANMSWDRPVAIVTNRESSEDKIDATLSQLHNYGFNLENVFIAMRKQDVSHKFAEKKFDILRQLKVEKFYVDDNEEVVREVINQTDLKAFYYSSAGNPEKILKGVTDELGEITIISSAL